MAEDFDRIIGDCEAVTDAPTCMLGEEIIRAYPDAKVILNRRNDIDAWDCSFRKTLCKGIRDSYWLKAIAWLSADYFWLRQISLRYMYDFFDGSVEKYGKATYEKHYEKLEDLLQSSKSGKYLSWNIEDGWEPLCKYLGKEIPETPFPSGNAPDAFMSRIRKRRETQVKTAKWNAALLVGTLFTVTLGFDLRVPRRHHPCGKVYVDRKIDPAKRGLDQSEKSPVIF
ncbi:MAG: hypothetical protein Q9191_006310 [Dirinaria sp. TL-2023a]